MHQTVSTITDDAVQSRVLPDVAGARPDGKVDVVEVLSPGQTQSQMERKIHMHSEVDVALLRA